MNSKQTTLIKKRKEKQISKATKLNSLLFICVLSLSLEDNTTTSLSYFFYFKMFKLFAVGFESLLPYNLFRIIKYLIKIFVN